MIDKHLIYQDASIVDLLIHLVKKLLAIWNWVVSQFISDLALGLHVTDAVRLEQLPFLRRILRHITSPAAVRLGRLTRHREIPDEVFSFLQLLLPDRQYLTHAFQ